MRNIDGCCHKTVRLRCADCPYRDPVKTKEALRKIDEFLDRAKTIDCPVCGNHCEPTKCRYQLELPIALPTVIRQRE